MQAAMNLPLEYTRQLAWETVAGVSYVPTQAEVSARPAVVRAATAADWRRQGFSFRAKVCHSMRQVTHGVSLWLAESGSHINQQLMPI